MRSAAAIVLVSLLLLRRVSVQSSIFITGFKNVVICHITVADSSTKSKLLEALCTIQTPVLMTILNSKEPLDLAFQISLVNEVLVFLRILA